MAQVFESYDTFHVDGQGHLHLGIELWKGLQGYTGTCMVFSLERYELCIDATRLTTGTIRLTLCLFDDYYPLGQTAVRAEEWDLTLIGAAEEEIDLMDIGRITPTDTRHPQGMSAWTLHLSEQVLKGVEIARMQVQDRRGGACHLTFSSY